MEHNGIIKRNKTNKSFTSRRLRNEKHAGSSSIMPSQIAIWSHSESTLALPAVIRPQIEWFITEQRPSALLHHRYLPPPFEKQLLSPPAPMKEGVEDPSRASWPPMCQSRTRIRTQITFDYFAFQTPAAVCETGGWATLSGEIQYGKSTRNTVWSTNAADLY